MKKIIVTLLVFTSLFASSQTQFLGAPNVTVVNKGNFKIDSILYLPKRTKTPTDTGALRYQISDSTLYVWTGTQWIKARKDGTVTSVGLTMPTAFAVANSPVTTSGTLAVTATGSATEYIRGDGTLGTLPTSGGGGGSGVNYYLNGSVSQGTIGGSTYYEMNKVPVLGSGTNFSTSSDGLIAQFITDSLDPNRLLIPAGAWNFELYFSASSGGGSPSFYVEILKYNGSTFTSIASSVSNPIGITNGTVTSLYNASLAVSETVLLATDRLAVRVSVNVSGRTITLHTEDNNLAEIRTTFAGGVVSLNGLTANDQFFATGTTGTDFGISSTTATHTFNLPTASATNRGALSSTDWSTFNNKVNISDTATMLTPYLRKVDTTSMLSPYARTSNVNASLALKVNISDTSSMLTPYLRKVDTTAMLSPYYRSAAATAALALKVNISDTSSMLTNYIRHAGFGLTKSGQALLVDSASIATRARVQKGIDSLGQVKQNVITNPVTGTGTLNYIPKWSSSSAIGNSQIFDDGTNVGISTITPSYKVDINGTLRNTTSSYLNTTSGETYVGTTTDVGDFKLQVNGNQYVGGSFQNTTGANLATSSGNVVIGSTSSGSDKATVEATNYRGMTIRAGTNAHRPTLTFINTADSRAAYIQQDSSSLAFGTVNSDYGGHSERMRINQNGNFGINTTSPTERLHVSGRARVTTIDSTSTGMNMLYADANGVIKKTAIPAGGGGTVTSIVAGTGLTGGTITTSGTIAVDTASIATRLRVQKGIDSVATLANTKLTGTGIAGYFPKWTGTSSQDTSQLFQLGKNIGIGTASPTYRLHLPDVGSTADQAMIAGTIFGSDGNGVTLSPGGSNLTIKGGQGNGSIYSGTISSVGRWGINTTSLNDAVFSVNGDVKIVTIDSTSTARNMLYQDANGVIKKAAGLSMSDDVMTASGSWVVTKDAGSGVSINNVAYTTNGTTKMVTVDGAFYIPETSWTDNTWITISTIPSGFRPSKTINWNSSYIISGGEYERSDNTDFTGACDIAGQMRIKDDGTVQIIATMNTNSIAAGGTDYIIVQFTQSYIIK